MKLVYFNDYRLGVLKGEQVVDVSAAVADIPHVGPGDLMSGLIARFDAYKPKLQAAADAAPGVPLASVSLRAPLPKPGNIVCMAVNYMENGTLKEAAPINAFHKAPTAIMGPGDTMVLPDVPASIFEGEAEMAIVIGKRAKNVSQADAFKHIFGYINFIDGSARGLAPQSFFHMKSRDTFAPIGPWLVTADEIADPNQLDLWIKVNGEMRQQSNTRHLVYDVARLIEFASSFYTLQPGDVIMTGTPEGVGPVKPGDLLEAGVAQVGELTIRIAPDYARAPAAT